jgi:2-polyprenyl-6-methoxyphenol hydroxylase-like FAD-dependent oxidoreductase
MTNPTPDVLVVDAVPVGLVMAAELARQGVSCRIIDQLATPLPYCRTIRVTPRIEAPLRHLSFLADRKKP